MEIKLTVRALIDKAKEKSGQSLGELALELNRNQTRISEWRTGKAKPDANEIAFFAEKAGLPVLETVAEIEEQMNPQFAHIWAKALGNLRAAGVAATVTLVPLTSLTTSMIDAANKITSL